MFYREQHWASQLLKPVMHKAIFTLSHTNDILYTVLFIGIENVDVVKYCLIIFYIPEQKQSEP